MFRVVTFFVLSNSLILSLNLRATKVLKHVKQDEYDEDKKNQILPKSETQSK